MKQHQAFVEALREVLGLSPLYGQPPTMEPVTFEGFGFLHTRCYTAGSDYEFDGPSITELAEPGSKANAARPRLRRDGKAL